MKLSMFRLLTTCFSIIVVAFFACSVCAQGKGGGKGGGGNGGGEDPPTSPFNYRLEYAFMPPGTTSLSLYQVRKVNGGMIAVGSYDVGGVTHGFVYDHSSQTLYDIFDNFGFESSCRAINSNGIVVGNIIDQTGSRRVYWLDYFSATPTLNLLDAQFPVLAGIEKPNAVDINVLGDILVDDLDNSVTNRAFVANPSDSSFVEFEMVRPEAISDSGFVVGEDNLPGPIYRVARWHPTMGKEIFLDMKTNDQGDVNIYGEFCALIDDPQKTNAWGTPCRVGDQIDWIAETNKAYYTSSLNDSGDVGFMEVVTTGKGKNSTTSEKVFFYHDSENQVFSIDSLVTDSFLNDNAHFGIHLTNRDSSLNLPTPIISGSTSDGLGDHRLFFLFPEEP